jgi:subtilisin family serine protease
MIDDNRGHAETTGRYVVVFADTDADPTPTLSSVAGLSGVASSRDFPDQLADTTQGSGTVFAELGVAVLDADPTQVSALRGAAGPRRPILSVSPELVYHPLDSQTDVDSPAVSIRPRAAGDGPDVGVRQFKDTAAGTWGLHATRALSSPWSGKDVKVAILDTGFTTAHPDFAGRSVTTASFISGETAEDAHGHGTHCTGTACGSKAPQGAARYGVAHEADIFIGKVLSNSGSGTDASVLGGMNWAINQGCAVISMSLGADVDQPHPPYTAVGQRALDRGSLIIAAAGNNARRHERNWGFVGAPANSPYIMAVAALEEDLSVTFFSARSTPGRGGQVDIAGPGWRVTSSWLMPQRYHTISGTSMATPHVAGVAALWAQATGARGRELWSYLAQEADRLAESSLDVSSGLVLAPR